MARALSLARASIAMEDEAMTLESLSALLFAVSLPTWLAVEEIRRQCRAADGNAAHQRRWRFAERRQHHPHTRGSRVLVR